MTTHIHIARDGKEIGVFNQEEVSNRLFSGELRLDDLAWWEGAPEWVLLDSIVEKPAVRMATGKQKAFIMSLGYKGNVEQITFAEASPLIDRLIQERDAKKAQQAAWNSGEETSVFIFLKSWLKEAESQCDFTQLKEDVKEAKEKLKKAKADLKAFKDDGSEDAQERLEDLMAGVKDCEENLEMCEEDLQNQREDEDLPEYRKSARSIKKIRYAALMSMINGTFHVTGVEDWELEQFISHPLFVQLNFWFHKSGAYCKQINIEQLKDYVDRLDAYDPEWERNPSVFFNGLT